MQRVRRDQWRRPANGGTIQPFRIRDLNLFSFFLKKKINDIRERDKEENEARDLTVAHRIVVSL